MSSSSTRKSVNESIWVAKLRELWGRKFEYAALIYNTIAYRFSSKRETDRSLYVFQCLQTFLLFSDRGNQEGTIILAIMNSPLRCLYDLATELIVGKIMYKFDNSASSIFWGKGALIHLFIIVYTFVKLCGCQCIWDCNLRNTGKSVTNWVTHMLLWKVWTQESFQK